ncbi:hypothetical protein BGW42_004799 [Actinomortierella wolfii]|nr:hypothetical protein BGW42_004799 [Actinomortierella wolfii]
MNLARQLTMEEVMRDSSFYSGLMSLRGRVTRVSDIEHIAYSQTFICRYPRCNNHNYLHFTPHATRDRTIKRSENLGFMETGTRLCGHCGQQMIESIVDRVYTSAQHIDLQCLGQPLQHGCFTNQVTLTLHAKPDPKTYHYGIEMQVCNVVREYETLHGTVPDSFEIILQSE